MGSLSFGIRITASESPTPQSKSWQNITSRVLGLKTFGKTWKTILAGYTNLGLFLPVNSGSEVCLDTAFFFGMFMGFLSGFGMSSVLSALGRSPHILHFDGC